MKFVVNWGRSEEEGTGANESSLPESVSRASFRLVMDRKTGDPRGKIRQHQGKF